MTSDDENKGVSRNDCGTTYVNENPSSWNHCFDPEDNDFGWRNKG